LAEMTAENAITIVTQKFRAVHKSIETAQDNALELSAAFLQAGRILGVHPNQSAFAGEYLARVISDLASAQLASTGAHAGAKEIAADLSNPVPLGGGGGKGWP